MLVLKQLFFGLLLPAVVSGAVLIFERYLSSKQDAANADKQSSGWLVGVALSAGYIVGHLGLEGLPSFPPRLGIHWLCYLAIIGLIVAGFWHFRFGDAH